MDTGRASPWARVSEGMRHRMDQAVDRMADMIKDAILDGIDLEEGDDRPLVDLPPLWVDEFVARMRERVEETLREVAEVLNASPGPAITAAVEEETADLFTELWWSALRTGMQMRVDAALGEALPADVPPPEGEWARRYRQMHADDPTD